AWKPLQKGVNWERESRHCETHDLFQLTKASGQDSKTVLGRYRLDMEELLSARHSLLDSLALSDDEFCEKQFLVAKSPELTCSPEHVMETIRRATLAHKAVPVLVGSSFTDVAVTPLMNAMVNFLPNPTERPLPLFVQEALSPTKSDLIFIFKIFHSIQREAISLARVYAGSLDSKTGKMTNLSRKNEEREQIHKILRLTGDSVDEIESCHVGDIVALSGLKHAKCGDLLSTTSSSEVCTLVIDSYSQLEIK
ncbi:G elongation factor, mitochondrial 2, partial [Cichlidogyrus casuarinus]